MIIKYIHTVVTNCCVLLLVQIYCFIDSILLLYYSKYMVHRYCGKADAYKTKDCILTYISCHVVLYSRYILKLVVCWRFILPLVYTAVCCIYPHNKYPRYLVWINLIDVVCVYISIYCIYMLNCVTAVHKQTCIILVLIFMVRITGHVYGLLYIYNNVRVIWALDNQLNQRPRFARSQTRNTRNLLARY